MITLFITRHGRTNFNEKGLTSGWDNSELIEEGKLQAAKIGERLKIIKPDFIFCSTLQRAIDTASIIQSICGGVLIQRDELKEKNLGKFQGIPETEYQAFLKKVSGDLNLFRPEGGESRQDVKERVAPVISEIERNYEGKTILIVGHHSTNRSILSVCLGGDPSTYTQRNGSLSLLHFQNERWIEDYLDTYT